MHSDTEKVSPKSEASQVQSKTDSAGKEVIDLTGSPPQSPKPHRINTSPLPKSSKREREPVSVGSKAPVETGTKIPELATVVTSQKDVLPPTPITQNQQTTQIQLPEQKETAKARIILDCLHKFDLNTLRMLQNIPPSTPEEASPETKELWTQSTATWPQIFESRFCWKRHPPSGVDLIIQTCNSIAARKEALAKGIADDYEFYVPAFSQSLYDEKLDPLTAVAQLSHPDITKPAALLGYRLPELLPDGSLVTPETLTQFIEPFNQDNLQVLLTPEFWVTDLHIGMTATPV